MKTFLYDPSKFTMGDRWREMYNPLEWLTLRKVVAWLNNQQLGTVSDIAWLYDFIERRNPVLLACIQRRTSAMEKLDWDVKMVPEDKLPDGCTVAMAKKQQTRLREAYENLDNLRQAVNWLEMADFRGYAHLEKHYDGDGNPNHLAPVPQWNWARVGRTGDWYYNRRALQIFANPPSVSADLTPIDTENFIIREVAYPVDEVAVFADVRTRMCQKDWDGFIETFGINPIFIELPPNMPAEQQQKYQETAEAIISDARGTLPNGAKVQTVDAAGRGRNPFKEHMDYQNEMIVLAATGGKLTVLAESGSGTLAGGAHKDTFDAIAEADAMRISEIFRRHFDKPILDEEFATEPVLAYFELAGKELTDTGAVVKDVTGLAAAGFSVDPAQVEELTNYRVSARPAVNKAVDRAMAGDADIEKIPGTENRARAAAYLNRQEDAEGLTRLLGSIQKHIDEGNTEAWAPIVNRIEALLDCPDDAYHDECKKLVADIPGLLKPTDADAQAVKAWEDGLSATLVNGLTARPLKTVQKARNRAIRPYHPFPSRRRAGGASASVRNKSRSRT